MSLEKKQFKVSLTIPPNFQLLVPKKVCTVPVAAQCQASAKPFGPDKEIRQKRGRQLAGMETEKDEGRKKRPIVTR